MKWRANGPEEYLHYDWKGIVENLCLIELIQIECRTRNLHGWPKFTTAIKSVAVNLVMQMKRKYGTERPISGCQFVCIIWLKCWKAIEVNNVFVESRIEIKRQQPHCGFWEEGKENSHVFHDDRKVRATEWWKSLPNWAISNSVLHLKPHAWPRFTTQQSRV